MSTAVRTGVGRRCPGCRKAMRELTLGAALGKQVSVSVCGSCHAFWFDPYENLHLTREATLQLFELIAGMADPAGHAPFPADCVCPACGSKLVHTWDRQRNTRFEYLRCEQGHGRFTRFVDFLKEKDYIRRLSPEQIAELRRTLPSVRCSGCGSSIDLGERSVCSHCGAAVSMLDVKKLMKIAGPSPSAEPAQRDGGPAARAATLTKEQVAALFEAAKQDRERESRPVSLVDLGLRLFYDWLRG